jgi:hypothetical protein
MYIKLYILLLSLREGFLAGTTAIGRTVDRYDTKSEFSRNFIKYCI